MNEQGFSVFESVISPPDCDDLLRSIVSSGIKLGKGGTRNLMSVASVRKLAADERMTNLAESLLGQRPIPFKATLFEKTGRSNWLVAWHQDTSLPVTDRVDLDGWGPMSIKEGIRFVHAPTAALSRVVALRLHLDPSTADNGPLRVIPETHKKRFSSDSEFERALTHRESYECLVGKGGVVAMSPLLIHASSKARVDLPRSVLHIEYADTLEIAPDVHLAIA